MRLLWLSLLSMIFFSCQRELDDSFLTDTGSNGTAVFTLSGSPNTCSHVVPGGIYRKNTALTSANTIIIDVMVTQAGTWTASTNTVNGITFSGSASFSASGAQTISLKGSGTPTTDGSISFTLTAGSNQCSFVLTVSGATGNIPPVANAGADKSITLPTSSVTLTGNGTDTDGTIASYAWTKISGPATFTIVNPTQAQTVINGLVQGAYQFQLAVTDNAGATGKDTVSVTVQATTVTAGTLAMQQTLYAVVTAVNAFMEYDGNNNIVSISSNHYPGRKIYYANNRISKIEYLYGIGAGQSVGETHDFIYDANGNVIKINETPNTVSPPTYVIAEFTYNSNNRMTTRKTYAPGSQQANITTYLYTGNNLTSYIQNMPNPNPGDTINITYDNRTNNFKNICPQAYFLDVQTIFDQNYRSEMFYFSNNYPTSIGTLPIAVSVNTNNQKPFEVRYGGDLWYRYIYN